MVDANGDYTLEHIDVFRRDIVNRGTAVQQHTTMGKLRSLGAPCSAAGVNNAGGALGIEIFIQ